jgi:hypothetical protein
LCAPEEYYLSLFAYGVAVKNDSGKDDKNRKEQRAMSPNRGLLPNVSPASVRPGGGLAGLHAATVDNLSADRDRWRAKVC